MRAIYIGISMTLLVGCARVQKTTTVEKPHYTPFQVEYYEQIETNIARLHRLMQGTFVAHSEEAQQAWNVTGTDSVILLTKAIGDPAEEGYWLYSYEFMTSLPNHPIYTTIKRIEQVERDSFRLSYYAPPAAYKLPEVLRDDFAQDWDFKTLKPTDKKVTYTRESAAHFIGTSEVYEDKECRCLRQNVYDTTPLHLQVRTTFYNKKDRSQLDKKNRPNLMLRRYISEKTLWEIAEKEYSVDN